MKKNIYNIIIFTGMCVCVCVVPAKYRRCDDTPTRAYSAVRVASAD